MRFVEGVFSKFFPFCPDFLKNFGVVAVGNAAVDKFRLHGIDDVFLLLTHCLTQGVTLAAGEIGELAAKKHHLLLIHGDSVGVLEVLLHARDVVGDGGFAVFTCDEVWDFIHRTRTIKGVHGYKVLELRGF